MAKPNSKRNELRVIGGRLRSRRIAFPDCGDLRPTGDRIRETLFNWLRDEVVSARCLDLFAGSGILSIEALSRGATWVDLVEQDRVACRSLGETLHQLGLEEAAIYQADAFYWLASGAAQEPYQIVFIDPPYRSQCHLAICRALDESGYLAEGARIYLENDRPMPLDQLPKTWRQLKQKRAGQVHYTLFSNDAVR